VTCIATTVPQAIPAPSIDRRNAKGVTVRSLAAAMMSREDIDDW